MCEVARHPDQVKVTRSSGHQGHRDLRAQGLLISGAPCPEGFARLVTPSLA